MKTFLIKMLMAMLTLVLFSIRFVDATIGESLYEHPLETAWKETGIKLEGISTEAWFKVNDRWLTVSELKELSREVERLFDMKLRSERLSGEEPEFTYVSFEGIRPDQTMITVTIQSTRTYGTQETQMGIYTYRHGRVANLKQYLSHLENLMRQMAGDNHFTIVLEGTVQGKLGNAVVKELTGKAFRKLEAQLVESHYEGAGSMTKGYTRRLPYVDRASQQSINLVISTIYDESRKVTEVVMATPALSGNL
ncbi:MAG TPA: YwmB family TATA-box binding protein [Bacillota bacterium]|nr:YwmB family TATA-box binding protein [Bacillota bacterium]